MATRSESAPRVRIDAGELSRGVARLGAEIAADYADRNPLLLGALKGSFIFLADLVRAIDVPCEVDFIMAASYGAGTVSRGSVDIDHLPSGSAVAGRHVILVDDIVDTGRTQRALIDTVRKLDPASIGTCALLVKNGSAHKRSGLRIDYRAFDAPEGFLVGYGLDLAERYRNLSDLCVLPDDDETHVKR